MQTKAQVIELRYYGEGKITRRENTHCDSSPSPYHAFLLPRTYFCHPLHQLSTATEFTKSARKGLLDEFTVLGHVPAKSKVTQLLMV